MTLRTFDPGGQRGETESGDSGSPRGSHFSPRTALIGLSAVFVAIIAGLLSYASHHPLATSVVTGAAALVGAFVFFDKIIGD
jgi:hypothetical protein